MPKNTLHLCDFDGTLTRGDSFIRFLVYSVPLWQLMVGGMVLMIQFFALFLSGKWSNEAGKEAILSYFYKGKTAGELEELGMHFNQKKLPNLLRLELLDALRLALKEGNQVTIVSASADIWLRPFCTAEGFDLICTELAFHPKGKKAATTADKPPFNPELIFSGVLATPNCNGVEKARRIQQVYQLDSFEKIIAYGNSRGDAAMFGLADEIFKF